MNVKSRTSSLRKTAAVAMVVLTAALAAPVAHATYPVIDVAAIKQLVMQVNYWKQQITAMKNELTQLQQTHAALTGGRGMEALLPTATAERNYLPADWTEMSRVLDGSSAQYGALSAAVSAAIEARAVLDDARLASLSEAERASVLRARQSVAASAVMAQRAYANAGQRFAALQGLVQAVGQAPDAKAIADLQGRIAAEEAMLGNEQAKLATLAQALQAEQWAQALQLREAAIAGHGQFQSRLRPVLPH
jgi:type IV secretion system protein VirB5